MQIVEGFERDSPEVEYERYKRGEADGMTGKKVDFEYIDSDAYFRGYKLGKEHYSKTTSKKIKSRIPPKLKHVVTQTIYENVLDFLRSGESIGMVDPPHPNEVMPNDIEKVLVALANEVESGGITLYRTMDVPVTYAVTLLKPNTNLGFFWSTSSHSTMGHHGIDSHQVKMEAFAPLSSINWTETVAVRLNDIEREVRLIPGMPVKLISAWMSPGGTEHWEKIPGLLGIDHVA